MKCVKAFELCIPLMDREETCELVTDSHYAYGELGRFVQLYSHLNFSWFRCCNVVDAILIF